jgi:hypothetical protein
MARYAFRIGHAVRDSVFEATFFEPKYRSSNRFGSRTRGDGPPKPKP